MKALSIRNPWAWMICNGLKDVENRDWPTSFRGRIYVHAGKKPDGNNYTQTKIITTDAQKILADIINVKREDWLAGSAGPVRHIWELVYLRSTAEWRRYYGAIIGEVDIVDCVAWSKSPWFVGNFGFVLRNPVLYDKPIPCPGKLGFFDVSDGTFRKEGIL